MKKYEQIYNAMLKQLEEGKFKEGDKLPSESELIQKYGVSRGTVRKAVDLLQERGYVQKIHGKGIFVLRKKNIELHFSGIVSLKEVNEQLHSKLITNVVEMKKVTASHSLMQKFEVEENTTIDLIKRVRNLDGENIILDINHFVTDIVPGLTKEIAEASIYEYIEKELQLKISYAYRVIEAQPCTEEDRKYLDLNGMDYVIVVKNLTHLYDGTAFEYTESRHRLDKFYFADVARR